MLGDLGEAGGRWPRLWSQLCPGAAPGHSWLLSGCGSESPALGDVGAAQTPLSWSSPFVIAPPLLREPFPPHWGAGDSVEVPGKGWRVPGGPFAQRWDLGIPPIPNPSIPAGTSVTSSLLPLPRLRRTTGQLLGAGLPAPLRAHAERTRLLLQQLLPAGRGPPELQRSVRAGRAAAPARCRRPPPGCCCRCRLGGSAGARPRSLRGSWRGGPRPSRGNAGLTGRDPACPPPRCSSWKPERGVV